MKRNDLPHDHGNPMSKEFAEALDSTDFQGVADLFKQLGDSSRLRIFWLLCHREECVINISAAVGMTSPAVSHHLRILKSSGLISSRREGKEMYYKAAESKTSVLLHSMIEKMVEIQCPGQ